MEKGGGTQNTPKNRTSFMDVPLPIGAANFTLRLADGDLDAN